MRFASSSVLSLAILCTAPHALAQTQRPTPAPSAPVPSAPAPMAPAQDALEPAASTQGAPAQEPPAEAGPARASPPRLAPAQTTPAPPRPRPKGDAGRKAVTPPGAPAVPPTTTSTAAPTVAPAAARPVWLFPDWPAPSFDWGAYPVIGLSYDRDSETRVSKTTIEGGVGARLWGLALKEGNPGASVSPQAGYALGYVTQKADGEKLRSGVYHRIWTGVSVPILVKFTKTTPGIRYAQVNGKIVQKERMGAFDFDEGILVLPFFATHYTYEYTRLFRDSWSDRLLTSHDNWFSLRLFTSVLNASVAFGPGVTFTKFYVANDNTALGTTERSAGTQLLANTRTQYLKLVGSSDLFWKVRASLDSKYIIDVKRKEGGLIDTEGVRLPDQAPSDPPRLPLYPEDSLITSAFFGIKSLFGPLGFGYRYTLEILNLSERDGAKLKKRETSGVGLFLEARL